MLLQVLRGFIGIPFPLEHPEETGRLIIDGVAAYVAEKAATCAAAQAATHTLGRVNNRGYTMVPTDWRSWSDGAFDTSG